MFLIEIQRTRNLGSLKCCLVLLFIFYINNLWTSYPGNVGITNLTGWWRASDLSAGNVTSWTSHYPSGGSAITLTEDGVYPQC